LIGAIGKYLFSCDKKIQDIEPQKGTSRVAGTDIGQSCEALKHVTGLKNKIYNRN